MNFRQVAFSSLALCSCLLAAAGAHAVTTRMFSLDSAGVLSDGKLEGAAVLSSGAVVPSVAVRRIALDNVALARSVLVRPDGTAIVGTGNNGKLYKVCLLYTSPSPRDS